jgi:hypothetical protein
MQTRKSGTDRAPRRPSPEAVGPLTDPRRGGPGCGTNVSGCQLGSASSRPRKSSMRADVSPTPRPGDTTRRRRSTTGSAVAARRPPTIWPRERGPMITRRSRTASRPVAARLFMTAFARRASGPAGARACSPASRGWRTPRCIAARSDAAARVRRARRARWSDRSSGPARANCCRWRPSAWRASQAPGTRSPAIALAPGSRSASALAGSSATRSSMTTAGRRSPKSTATSAPKPSLGS